MQAKIKYVDERHTVSIKQMEKGVQKGRWKTYWGHGKARKAITRSSEKEIYDELYMRYKALEDRPKTLEDVFNLLEEYKRDCLDRSEKTLNEDKRLFHLFPEEFRNRSISNISEEDVRKVLISTFKDTKPTESAMKKSFQILNRVFLKGKKICLINPIDDIEISDYIKFCNHESKKTEEKQFSEDELAIIEADCWKDWRSTHNPRALMALLAKETGPRVGELCAIHKEDVEEEYIHIHRQQIRDEGQKPHRFYEVGYTKDEAKHPHDGRRVPITKEARRIIEEAKKIPGDSAYLFHEKNKEDAIIRDGYCLNLRKRTRRLGIKANNNHAFRMAFNTRLINLGFSPSDRALILGHKVPTNENNYSRIDERRLADIKARLLNEKK